MAEFRLGRVKFNWTGNWAPSKSYLIDDIAKFGGNTYVAVANHTSTAALLTSIPTLEIGIYILRVWSKEVLGLVIRITELTISSPTLT